MTALAIVREREDGGGLEVVFPLRPGEAVDATVLAEFAARPDRFERRGCCDGCLDMKAALQSVAKAARDGALAALEARRRHPIELYAMGGSVPLSR
ncbi:MAG: hypothetical protein U1E23_14695 [Reyranellaceae bacterium]